MALLSCMSNQKSLSTASSFFNSQYIVESPEKQISYLHKTWRGAFQQLLSGRARYRIKQDIRIDNAMYMATQNRHARSLEKMLSRGACGNQRTADGYTPLHAACRMNWEVGVRMLLRYKVNTDIVGPDGLGAVHIAAQHGFSNIIRVLIQYGANIDVDISSSGSTCLILASKLGHFEVLKILIQAGVDVDGEDRMGNTALHYAVQSGNYEFCEALLAAGADCLTMNAEGKSPLSDAQSLGDCRILYMLYANSAKSRHKVSMDTMMAVVDSNVEKLLKERPEMALIILKNRFQYARFYDLGCVLEE